MIAKIPGAKRFTILLLNWNIFSEDRSKDYRHVYLDTTKPMNTKAVAQFARTWEEAHNIERLCSPLLSMDYDRKIGRVTYQW